MKTTKFQSSVTGYITAIRIFRATGDVTTSTVGKIWLNNDPTILAQVTFTDTTTTGAWITQDLATPLLIFPNVEYTVSANLDAGSFYPEKKQFFASARTSGYLSNPVNAGVFSATPASFPSSSWESTSYFRDVVFKPCAISGEKGERGEQGKRGERGKAGKNAKTIVIVTNEKAYIKNEQQEEHRDKRQIKDVEQKNENQEQPIEKIEQVESTSKEIPIKKLGKQQN